MELKSVHGSFLLPKIRFSHQPLLCEGIYSPSNFILVDERVRLRNSAKCRASRIHTSNVDKKLNISVRSGASVPRSNFSGVEPFQGKPGSVSFRGLSYQLVEERKLESSPFKEGTGSLLWAVAPVALISSLVLPPLFIANAVDTTVRNEILAEIVTSLSAEAVFYVGLATFLVVTDHVQRPYLQFSAKRWGLITGLKGYLTSAFFTMGLKVVAPILVVFVTWPVLGLQALVAVAPFLLGCLAQLAFETYLEKRNSSCWPLIPIIFEIYRLYQLTKAANLIERLMFAMRGLPATPELMERSGALVAMLVTIEVLGVACLWSLMTFLLRLFPSRPVKENY
ncbi:hypothetical protein Ancab_016235 [Ancistrocladus abbreviatus]